MTSQERFEINQRNAQHSTGPRTPEGKAKVSKNPMKHGLFTKDVVITGGDGQENMEEYLWLLEGLKESLQPQGMFENLLVEKITVNYWRLRRLVRYETAEIRRLLDGYRNEVVDNCYTDPMAALNNNAPERPEMKYLSYSEPVSRSAYKAEQDLGAAMSSDGFDLISNARALEHVFLCRLGRVINYPGEEERNQALALIKSLSPEERQELRKDVLGHLQQFVAEMREVLSWESIFDQVARIRSIPRDESLINKIMKYETGLERSLSNNLSMLQDFQDRRRSANSRRGGVQGVVP